MDILKKPKRILRGGLLLASLTSGCGEDAVTGTDTGPVGFDSGPPGFDSGTPGFDSGTPGFDSGTPTMLPADLTAAINQYCMKYVMCDPTATDCVSGYTEGLAGYPPACWTAYTSYLNCLTPLDCATLTSEMVVGCETQGMALDTACPESGKR